MVLILQLLVVDEQLMNYPNIQIHADVRKERMSFFSFFKIIKAKSKVI